MLDDHRRRGIVALVVIAAVEGMQHPVVRADIDDFTAILVLLIKRRVGRISIHQIVVRAGADTVGVEWMGSPNFHTL